MFTPVQQSTALATNVNEALSYYRRDNPFQGRQEAYPWCL